MEKFFLLKRGLIQLKIFRKKLYLKWLLKTFKFNLPNGFNELIKTDELCTNIVNPHPIKIAK